jgi:hypothetical protein
LDRLPFGGETLHMGTDEVFQVGFTPDEEIATHPE